MLPAAHALGLGVLALVAARPGRAHRQVPPRHAQRLPRRVARTSPASSSATSTSGRPASSRRSAGRPTASAGRRCRWRWCGCATVRGSPLPIVGARTAAQLQAALATEELTLPDEIIAALDDVSGE